MNLELLNKLHAQTRIENGCWLWQGGFCGQANNPYGTIQFNGKKCAVSRISLCIFLRLDYTDKTWMACHICNNTACWNPLHLYQGTNQSNQLDAVREGMSFNNSKTHCINGHEYSKENTITILRTKSRRTGQTTYKERICRTCKSNNQRNRLIKKKTAVLEGKK